MNALVGCPRRQPKSVSIAEQSSMVNGNHGGHKFKYAAGALPLTPATRWMWNSTQKGWDDQM
jgi:hypothetical protein